MTDKIGDIKRNLEDLYRSGFMSAPIQQQLREAAEKLEGSKNATGKLVKPKEDE
jgi:hypothetical protein